MFEFEEDMLRAGRILAHSVASAATDGAELPGRFSAEVDRVTAHGWTGQTLSLDDVLGHFASAPAAEYDAQPVKQLSPLTLDDVEGISGPDPANTYVAQSDAFADLMADPDRPGPSHRPAGGGPMRTGRVPTPDAQVRDMLGKWRLSDQFENRKAFGRVVNWAQTKRAILNSTMRINSSRDTIIRVNTDYGRVLSRRLFDQYAKILIDQRMSGVNEDMLLDTARDNMIKYFNGDVQRVDNYLNWFKTQ